MDEHLGVGARLESMPAGGQLAPEHLVVVDLAVVDDLDGAVLARDRLVAGREIDHPQPAYRRDGARRFDHPPRVGPAVGEGVHHAADRVRIDRCAVEGDRPADPAHG
jgi:hypothetical protein